jgi:hypothetical protein
MARAVTASGGANVGSVVAPGMYGGMRRQIYASSHMFSVGDLEIEQLGESAGGACATT